MPQTGKPENTIQFNYIVGDELINVKYRDGRKNFKLYKGAEKVFYNINSIVGFDTCIITEGEMDVLALHEAGITNAISVPNGATLNSNNLDYLDNCIDYFEDKEKVILAVDNDEPGQALQQELIRRLGAEVCFMASFEDCKDANEYLIKYGKEQLKNKINDARPVPLENVKTFKDIEDEITDFVKNGFKPGYQIGLPNFDDIFSTYTGQFITVTGIPSSGKSDFVDQMVVGYNQSINGKQLLLVLKMLLLIYMLTSLCVRSGRICQQEMIYIQINGIKLQNIAMITFFILIWNVILLNLCYVKVLS